MESLDKYDFSKTKYNIQRKVKTYKALNYFKSLSIAEMVNDIKVGEYIYETLECDKQYNSDYSKDLRDLLRKKKEILKKEIKNYKRFDIV